MVNEKRQQMTIELTENDITALEVLCEIAMLKGGVNYENPILERVRALIKRSEK